MRTTPEGLTVHPIAFQEVFTILNSEALRAVEEPIAAAYKLPILRDTSPVIINLTQGELSVCGMAIEEIETYLTKHQAGIVQLALRLKEDSTGEDEDEYPEGEEQDAEGQSQKLGLGNGFGLKHAVYHYFLSCRSAKELRAFLKNRRIPAHTKFAKQLEAAYTSLEREDSW